MSTKLTALSILAVGVTGAANAAVTLVDTLVSTSEVDGLSYTIDGSGLNLTGASKLVMTIGSEGNSANGAIPAAISSLTYGGVALAVAAPTNNVRSNVWYVDLAGKTFTGTDIKLDFVTGGETNRGYGLSAFALGGTADGVSSTGLSGSVITTINPPTAGEFMIVSYSRNSVVAGTSGPATFPNPITPGVVELYEAGLDGQYTVGSHYATLASAGEQDIEIFGMNTSGRTVIATFAAPEPGSLALLSFGGLMMIKRRRR